MGLDVESLLAVNALNLLVLGGALPLIMGRQLSKTAARARDALLALAAGMVCIVLSGQWPGSWADTLLSALAVSLIALGLWLLFQGLQGWLGLRPGGRLLTSMILLAPLGYLLTSGSFMLRTAWANSTLILELLIVCRATLWPGTRLGGRWRWVIFAGTLCMAILTAARTVLVVFFPDQYPNFMAPHPVNVLAMLMSNVILVLLTVAILVAWREEAEASLQQQAFTDGLTNLANRYGWDDRAQFLFDQSRRHGGALAMILIDLDHFKRINDTHGHAMGDRVLKTVGDVFRGNRRASDLVARIGGEEFALLLPHTDMASATLFEQRLRQALQTANHANPALAVNYSAGLALLQPGESIATLTIRADAALYQAKNGGRGRTEIAP
jgi:diguanylate cyclase (GGDEF)-like protein